MKVLIVDDNKNVRQLLTDHMPASVDEIVEGADGCEAVALFSRHRPDWVLMDHEMPQMNGLSAISAIIAEFPQANICMVTAFDSEDLRAEAVRVGATAFVLKDNLFQLASVIDGKSMEE